MCWVFRKEEDGYSMSRVYFCLAMSCELGLNRALLSSFKDNITAIWDADLIAEYVKPYIEEHKIDIVRFDNSHENIT